MYNISNNTTISYGSNYPLLILPGRQQHQQQSFNAIYDTLIVEEAEKLYNTLAIKLTNEVTAAVAIRAPSLPTDDNRHKLTHKNNTYQTEELRYNNQPEIYNKDQDQLNE